MAASTRLASRVAVGFRRSPWPGTSRSWGVRTDEWCGLSKRVAKTRLQKRWAMYGPKVKGHGLYGPKAQRDCMFFRMVEEMLLLPGDTEYPLQASFLMPSRYYADSFSFSSFFPLRSVFVRCYGAAKLLY